MLFLEGKLEETLSVDEQADRLLIFGRRPFIKRDLLLAADAIYKGKQMYLLSSMT
jgi:hypothetical protein